MPQSFEQLLRCDALTFVRQSHRELHGTPLDNDKYLELLAHDVEDIVLGDTRHYVCNLPPGFAKTSMFSVAMPAWILGHNPSARILIIAYSDDLVTDISRKIRAILRARWFRRAFPKTSLAMGHQRVRDFETEAGGCVYARSIDGGTTGIRCEYLFIDDPVKMADSGNSARLARVNETFDGELKSRLNNPMTGTIVIVHQRLNRCDLTGHVLKQRGLCFKHRCLALVATHDHKYQLKHGTWLRKEGDILRASLILPNTSPTCVKILEHQDLALFTNKLLRARTCCRFAVKTSS